MTTLTLHREPSKLIVPQAREPIAIRVGEARDLKFIDDLQRKHSKMVGWMPTVQLETNIKQGNFLIAEERDKETQRQPDAVGETSGGESPGDSVSPSLRRSRPIGYCLFKDKYFRREDVGIIYQLNVAPHKQRGLVGAELVKSAFERSAYGCKLFCCWCAQDIEANYFWESIGFVPLAFRAGSRGQSHGGKRKEGRIHIFWQKRIREGDTGVGATPFWFPSETSGGALKENRIVLPIMPGTHWSDAKPLVLPGAPHIEATDQPALGSDGEKAGQGGPKRRRSPKPKPVTTNPRSIALGGLRFAAPAAASDQAMAAEKAAKPKREKQKNDPRYVAAARDLCARFQEELQAGRILPGGEGGLGKYEVSRSLAGAGTPAEGAGTLRAENLLTAQAA